MIYSLDALRLCEAIVTLRKKAILLRKAAKMYDIGGIQKY